MSGADMVAFLLAVATLGFAVWLLVDDWSRFSREYEARKRDREIREYVAARRSVPPIRVIRGGRDAC